MRWSQLVVKMRLPGLLRISFKQTCLQTNMICLQYTLMDLMLSILKKVRTCNKVIFFSPHFNLHFNNKKKTHKNTKQCPSKYPQQSSRTTVQRFAKGGELSGPQHTQEKLYEGGHLPRGECLGHKTPPQRIAKKDLSGLDKSTKANLHIQHLSVSCWTLEDFCPLGSPDTKHCKFKAVTSNVFIILCYQTDKAVQQWQQKNNLPLLEDDDSSRTWRAGQEKDLQWKKN